MATKGIEVRCVDEEQYYQTSEPQGIIELLSAYFTRLRTLAKPIEEELYIKDCKKERLH